MLGLFLRSIFQTTDPYSFSVAQQSNSGLGSLNFEVSRPHTQARASALGIL
jgi:hypothetical protein